MIKRDADNAQEDPVIVCLFTRFVLFAFFFWVYLSYLTLNMFFCGCARVAKVILIFWNRRTERGIFEGSRNGIGWGIKKRGRCQVGGWSEWLVKLELCHSTLFSYMSIMEFLFLFRRKQKFLSKSKISNYI